MDKIAEIGWTVEWCSWLISSRFLKATNEKTTSKEISNYLFCKLVWCIHILLIINISNSSSNSSSNTYNWYKYACAAAME